MKRNILSLKLKFLKKTISKFIKPNEKILMPHIARKYFILENLDYNPADSNSNKFYLLANEHGVWVRRRHTYYTTAEGEYVLDNGIIEKYGEEKELKIMSVNQGKVDLEKSIENLTICADKIRASNKIMYKVECDITSDILTKFRECFDEFDPDWDDYEMLSQYTRLAHSIENTLDNIKKINLAELTTKIRLCAEYAHNEYELTSKMNVAFLKLSKCINKYVNKINSQI